MKIAMLTNNYRPFVGGVPVSVERQAKALRALGHEVTVFAPDYGDGKNGGQDPEEDHVVRCSCFKRKMCNGMVYPKVGTGRCVRPLSGSSLTVFTSISLSLREIPPSG